MNQSIVVD